MGVKPVKAGYSQCCPARCRCDHSSKRDLGPLLTSPDTVEEILAEAFRKTAGRAAAYASGEMSDEEVSAANAKLESWLADTFSGCNPYFGTTEDWNPEGLAEYISENFHGPVCEALGREPEEDRDFILGASRLLVAELWRTARRGEPGDGLVIQWSSVLTGAPTAW